MNLKQIFSVFSERHKTTDKVIKPLTLEFRHRVLELCTKVFAEYGEVFSEYADISERRSMLTFWSDIHEKLRFLLGRPNLTGARYLTVEEDAIGFLLECSDAHFLDFVEMIFQSKQPWVSGSNINLPQLVEDVNTLLEVDNLPYYLTQFVFPPGPPGSGRIIHTPRPEHPLVEVFPQIICREDEVLHQQAIGPTLLLLTESFLANANREFLDALKDYREGEYGDCVTKCGSSFESVMKIICNRKKWPYQQTDTAARLLKTILGRTTLDPFFEQPIMLIATIRNRLSKAHGAGTQQKTVSKHVANYVINATASAILLLVSETSP